MQLSENTNMQAALPAAWVAKLIQKMKVMYGTKFTQQWAGIDPLVLQEEWAEMLAGYTGEELSRGLDACRTRTFPPTLPEFMTLCRPPVQADAAFHEAVHDLAARRNGQHGEWSHPAIYHAACKVGSYDMLNNTYSALKGRWEKALADCLLDRNLEPVPPPAAALPAPEPMSKEEAKRVMRDIGAADVLKPKKDMKAWARKIIASPEGKSPAVLKMAQAALQEVA